MDGALLKINGDLFDISSRLKEIDVDYELFFNRRDGRFEIYAKGERQLCLPFPRLDARSLDYARKTRLDKFGIILAEIEENNRKIEEERIRAVKDKALADADF